LVHTWSKVSLTSGPSWSINANSVGACMVVCSQQESCGLTLTTSSHIYGHCRSSGEVSSDHDAGCLLGGNAAIVGFSHHSPHTSTGLKAPAPHPLGPGRKGVPTLLVLLKTTSLELAHSSAVGSLCNANGRTFCNQAAHCIHEFEPKTQHGTTNRPSTQNTHLSPFLGPLSCTNDCPTLQIGMHTPTCHHIYTPSVTVACAAWSPLTP
jgi:hypothetical protein